MAGNIDADVAKMIKNYNEQTENQMWIEEVDPDFYHLMINSNLITEGDIVDMHDRIAGINRENGIWAD